MEASYYRAVARDNLRGNWGRAILVALVAALLGGSICGDDISLNLDKDVWDRIHPYIASYIWIIIAVTSAFLLLMIVIGGVIRLGNCRYQLNQHLGRPCGVGDLFSQFHRFGDGFCLSILTAAYMFLWSLLFFIPGIIAAYSYAMAPYILLENPDIGASEAIKRSKELMRGNKGRLFCLDISFFGWSLLCALTLGLGGLFLEPYHAAATTAFYRDLVPEAPAVVDTKTE